jgi:hypothetical protein
VVFAKRQTGKMSGSDGNGVFTGHRIEEDKLEMN